LQQTDTDLEKEHAHKKAELEAEKRRLLQEQLFDKFLGQLKTNEISLAEFFDHVFNPETKLNSDWRWRGFFAHQNTVQSRPRTRSNGSESLTARFTLITLVDPPQGSDKTLEATEPEDLMPEAKTTRSGLKVVERGRLQKAAEGAMGVEKEADATSTTGRK
jgi:hypothetical protein